VEEHSESLIAEIIDRGQKRSEFDPSIDPRLAAVAFLSIAVTVLGFQVGEGRDLSDKEIRHQFLRLAFNGLGTGELGVPEGSQ